MSIEANFLALISFRFTDAFKRINHVMMQIDDRQLWHRPSRNSNSIGIILQHLIGNLDQWVGEAVGGKAYQRHRAEEFRERVQRSRGEMTASLTQLHEEIQGILSRTSPESLVMDRRIQGFDETVMSALLAAMMHLEYHTGQIMYVGKMMLDDRYREYWHPATPEQGKE